MGLLHPEEGKDGKTERGTSKKREDARKDGKLVCSSEINTVVVLAAAFAAFWWLRPYLFTLLKDFLEYWAQIDLSSEWTPKFVQAIMGNFVKVWFLGAISIGLVALVATVLANIAQTKPFFSGSVLKLKFDGLNPVTGLKNLFSKDSLIKLVISLLKVSLVSLVVWGTVRKHIPEIASLYRLGLRDALQWHLALLMKVIWKILVLYILIAVIDWIKEKRKFELNIMMTRQEIKDERKNQEGSPQVKQKVRRKMQELSFSRMMASVPDASVVITNPTHLAIAIKYDAKKKGAPIVVAKGKRLTAMRIPENCDGTWSSNSGAEAVGARNVWQD